MVVCELYRVWLFVRAAAGSPRGDGVVIDLGGQRGAGKGEIRINDNKQ